MIFLTPVWLALLLPWLAACVWTGRAARPPAAVPHLPLWPTQPTAGGGRRRRPPLWAVLLLAAGLLAILAAAGPTLQRPATLVTLLVDNGLSMSPPRRRAAAARLGLPPRTQVRVYPAIGPSVLTTAADLFGVLDRLPTTAEPTAGLLRAWIARPPEPGPLVVLSDRPPDGDPPDVIRVGPATPLVNAGIDRFAVTAGPHPQAMVRIFNGTAERRAVLRVDAVRRTIDLPPAGQTSDVFIDLPTVGPTAEAELLAPNGASWADDVKADDHAYLAQTDRPGRIVPRTPLGDPLARMAAVYTRQRPPEADAPAIAIVRGATDDVAVILADAFEHRGPAEPWISGPDHPVMRSLDLSESSVVERTAERPPGTGWHGLISGGSDVLLAVRESPARQVWVGFDIDALAARPEYVIFWTNVFDWLAGGGGAAVWDSGPPRRYDRAIARADPGVDASPGLYGGDAARPVLATAVPAVRPAPAGPDPVAGPVIRATQVRESLTPPILLAALALAAGGLWTGFRLTRY